MQAGIKVGPLDGIEILQKSQAKYVEIYYRLDWKNKYLPLFNYLNQEKIYFGLHYWDMIDGKYFPNLLYLDSIFAKKTYQSIKETINIAGKYRACYVNFHPESYRLSEINLDKRTVKTVNPLEAIDKEASFKQLVFYLKKIVKEAAKNKVLPFLETVPKYATADFGNIDKGRQHPQKSEGLETEKYFELAKMGFLFTLDLGHTMTHKLTEDRNELFRYLYQAAEVLKDNIKLFHITTNKPPFNDGVDTHNGILDSDWKQQVAPNRQELIKLLKLFKNRPDIWLIPEPPRKEMIENFYALDEVIKEIEG